MNPDKLMQAIGNIDEKFISEALEEAVSSDNEEEHSTQLKRGRKPFMKRLAVAAAVIICFGMILTSFNFIAKAYGIDTVAILREFGDRIDEMFAGEKVEFKGITIIKNGEFIDYDSIEMFLKQENFDVLYPTSLPKGVNLAYVDIAGYMDSNGRIDDLYKQITYVTDSPEISIVLTNSPNANKYFLKENLLEYKQINEINCYILYDINFTQCHFVHNNCVYMIKAPTEEDIIMIIENLKETES